MTTRTAPLPRRSVGEWAVRGMLALVATGAGYLAVTRSLANVERVGAPAAAHRLAPEDGRMTAAYAQLLAQDLANPGATAAQRDRVETVARTAVRQDATAVSAVSALALAVQLRGDGAGARRLFGYAERLSRRNLETQLWQIENAVARGDIPGALRHYDIALRTTPSANELLFPILANASSEPAIRTALVATLARRPMWADAFINRAPTAASDPRVIAALFVALSHAGVKVSVDATAATVDGLIKKGAVAEAWSFYAASHPGIDRSRSRDPRFVADLSTPSPFDWTPIDADGGAATIGRGSADFSMPASVGGAVLQQMQVLPAGDYRLDGHSAAGDQPDGALPYWSLACWHGVELGRVELPRSAGTFTGRFRVPAGCPVQMLTLIVRASDAIDGIAGTIDLLRLAPQR